MLLGITGSEQVHHITCHEGTYGEYTPTLSLTSALDRGEWLTPHRGRFAPGNNPVPIV